MTKIEEQNDPGKAGIYACSVSGKGEKVSNIKTHIKANHIERNISHPYDICGKVSRFHKMRSHNANFSRTKHNLRMYKSRSHYKGSTEIFFYN